MEPTLQSQCHDLLPIRVGQNHIYTVYIRSFWQGNHQLFGHIRWIYMVLDNPTYTRKNVMSINRGITTCVDQFPYVSLSHTHTHTHCFQGVEMDTNGVPRQKVGGVRLTPWLTWGSLRGKDSALHAHALTPALRKHWICPGCKTKIIGGCDLVLQDKDHWWVWSCAARQKSLVGVILCCKTKIVGGCDLVLQDKNHWWVWSCAARQKSLVGVVLCEFDSMLLVFTAGGLLLDIV